MGKVALAASQSRVGLTNRGLAAVAFGSIVTICDFTELSDARRQFWITNNGIVAVAVGSVVTSRGVRECSGVAVNVRAVASRGE